MKLNIEELAREAGIETKLWSMGAASLVYTEGCHGVARSEFEAFASLIVERCATALELTGNDHCADAIRNLMED